MDNSFPDSDSPNSSLPAEDSLLVSLSSYRPRPDKKSIEDFITEAFAWLLRSQRELGRSFLAEVESRLESRSGLQINLSEDVEWSTQRTFPQSRPDMVAEAGGKATVFEHKVREIASKDQLRRHEEGLSEHEEYSGGDLILITSAPWHYRNPADAKITWQEIYKWLDRQAKSRSTRMVKEFQVLLESEGLCPRPGLEERSLRAYLPAQKVEPQLENLFRDLWSRSVEWEFLFKKLPHLSRQNSELKPRVTSEGRLGIQFNGPSENAWTPGIFAGAHLDGSDHDVQMSKPDWGPDLAIVLDIGKRIAGMPRQEFLNSSLYRRLSDRLRENAKSRNWEVIDTFQRSSGGNLWHPLIVRRPLADVLRGTSSFAGQSDAILRILKDGLRFLVKDERIRKARTEK